MKHVLYAVIFAITFLGTMYFYPDTERVPNNPTVSETGKNKAASEEYAAWWDDALKAQHDQATETDAYDKKPDGKDKSLMLTVCLSAILAIIPTAYLLIQYMRNGLGLTSLREVLYVFGISVCTGVVCFALHTTALYIMFYAERSVRHMVLAAVLFGGGISLLTASINKNRRAS